MISCFDLIDKLEKEHILTREEFVFLIKNRTPEISEYLFEKAREVRHKYYGR